VRELRNLVEIASYSKKRPIDLAAYLATARLKTQKELPQPEFVADQPFKVSKDGVIRKFEVEYIKDLLRKHAGNVSRAAREAGIERSYLQRLIRKYGMGKDNVSELESQE
jgi:DNA-binding NtrC family response regulator